MQNLVLAEMQRFELWRRFEPTYCISSFVVYGASNIFAGEVLRVASFGKAGWKNKASVAEKCRTVFICTSEARSAVLELRLLLQAVL